MVCMSVDYFLFLFLYLLMNFLDLFMLIIKVINIKLIIRYLNKGCF